MAKPIILSDNLFDSTILHPDHVATNPNADDMAGREVWRVADNLRDVTSWTPAAQTAARFLRVDCLTAKPATMLVLDRGHNLGGRTFELQTSTDNFATTGIKPIVCTIPTTPGGFPTDANGCLTPDGVWWKTFGSVSARYWQARFGGATTAPIVAGLYLGTSYRFPAYLDAPGAYDYRTRVQYRSNRLSKRAVRVKRGAMAFDELNLSVQLDGADYDAFHAEVRRLLRYNHPWWFCLDDSTAPGAGLLRLFNIPGDTTYEPTVNPVHRRIALLLEEVIPSAVL
jgi:hypothetical protein